MAAQLQAVGPWNLDLLILIRDKAQESAFSSTHSTAPHIPETLSGKLRRSWPCQWGAPSLIFAYREGPRCFQVPTV